MNNGQVSQIKSILYSYCRCVINFIALYKLCNKLWLKWTYFCSLLSLLILLMGVFIVCFPLLSNKPFSLHSSNTLTLKRPLLSLSGLIFVIELTSSYTSTLHRKYSYTVTLSYSTSDTLMLDVTVIAKIQAVLNKYFPIVQSLISVIWSVGKLLRLFFV